MLDKNIKYLFESGASFYDLANRILSLGIDGLWRKEVARSIKSSNHGLVADIATGTAKVAIQITRKKQNLKVVGVDFSPNMLKTGQKKILKYHFENKILLLLGDGCALPFNQNSFDALTIVFGIRNIPERELALKEFYSVLKPQGQLIIMEFGFPQHPILKPLYLFYFDKILPRLGNFLMRWDDAYTYLNNSVHKFPSPEQFMDMIQAAGFNEVTMRRLTGGIVNLFQAIKD